jgi:hypothetical protein
MGFHFPSIYWTNLKITPVGLKSRKKSGKWRRNFGLDKGRQLNTSTFLGIYVRVNLKVHPYIWARFWM